MSVICQAGSLTRRFIVELERDAGSPKQNFSIKRNWHTLSGNPLDIAHINDYVEPDLPSDKKRHSANDHGIEKTIIESISWQWLYATNLQIAYELAVTTKVAPMIATTYLWLPLEVLVTVACLLKNYWNPNKQLFSPIEQQAASRLTQGDHPFATITAMSGSGENAPQFQSSESSSQPAPKGTLPTISSFISLLYNDYNGGNGGHQQYLHTLGLNCFIHPCHGFCQLHPLSDSSKPAEWPLSTPESSCVHLASGHCSSCMRHFYPAYAAESRQNPLFKTLNDLSDIQLPFDSESQFDGIDVHLTNAVQNTIEANGSLNDNASMVGHFSTIADDFAVISGSLDLPCLLKEDELAFTLTPSEIQQTTSKSSQLDQSQPHRSRTGAAKAKADSAQEACESTVAGEDGQQRPCGKVSESDGASANHKSKYHSRQQTCKVMVVGEDGQQRPCGKLCKNAKTLSNHKRGKHSGQQTCEVIIVGEDGQQRPCRKVCKSAFALSDHKSKYHTGQKVCEVTVVGEDGQQRPCGIVYKNAGSLADHKSTCHSGPKVCVLTEVGEDGQQRPCGKLYKNAKALSDHKSRYHRGQQTCEVIVFAEDGQQRSCAKLCKNAKALTNHKRSEHSRQKICEVIIFGEDGQQRQCGKVLKSIKAFWDHKSKYHSGQQTCRVIVFGEDGQQRPCGKLCKNAKVLIYHKSTCHSGQKTCAVIIFGEDGQQRPCGKVCKNAGALSNHKSEYHRGQQTCKVTVVGADGQQQPCGKVCKNARAMSYHKKNAHRVQQNSNLTVIEDARQRQFMAVCRKPQVLSDRKRRDRKRKPADVDKDDETSPPADKVSKCDYQEKLTD
ncbi:hypothetical protein [Endozoicomonas sp. 8E]|uniref:hypothetical protein n=1 Tax=Endozoicomonas sp. 8E TaxID=3035692 RepID=UPI0029393594|nr:hypothetical protein [Endozoicomonas sp. 8E]WOG26887.1 hypothetical protein P6910_20415 [Endozoicomonas sp. 8E]